MAARASIGRLARLTLYSGPNCSLCDIAKAELAKVRQTHSFDLDVINIQDPGQERWKRKYVYWIPALHLNGSEIAKGAESPDSRGTDGGNPTLELTCPFYSDVRGSSYDSLDWSWAYSLHFYERHADVILGDDSASHDVVDDNVSRCFNCGSTDHLVTSCPNPRDRELIALTRQLYNFFRTERATDAITISAAGDRKSQKLQWIDEFVPGEVRGPDLRDALGLRDGDIGNDVPWLQNMADWGYPSGWAAREDPRTKIRQMIEDEHVETTVFEEGECSLTVFGDGSEENLDLSTVAFTTYQLRTDTLDNADSDVESSELHPRSSSTDATPIRRSSTACRIVVFYLFR
ncbi:hypothetical protein EVG20_g9952 [Dentipellis fragilis]|uniref:CCHC-type domain-containing protein n=1 Tax=Dentipellis fragilis TaxID=205917 RepID=A0A4Y9XU85_9AGAM|nr:hypothetical protein EVG20_g9952 [Dentipellis fragilis]